MKFLIDECLSPELAKIAIVIGLDLRGALNPLTATTRKAFADAPEGSVASELRLGRGISEAADFFPDFPPVRLAEV